MLGVSDFSGKGMRNSESKGGGADEYECVNTPKHRQQLT